VVNIILLMMMVTHSVEIVFDVWNKIIMNYPKRLIEVDLPIKRISAHARREKSIGPLSTLHIWWARRPLAACRAVLCTSLWPDPADKLCPVVFRNKARELMQKWAKNNLKLLSNDSLSHFIEYQKNPEKLNDNVELRKALLDFIADFANWDNSTVKEYLETSRTLTQTAHEALGGQPGTRPLVVDPFAGGGSIPLEALRIGADAFASDLNPIAVLLNKVVLEYIPKYGQKLADEVRECGDWIKKAADKKLSTIYPNESNGAIPIAYLWAKTIVCEAPACGYEIPIIRGPWLSKAKDNSVRLVINANKNNKNFDIDVCKGMNNRGSDFSGTVRRGSVTCPACGYTIPRARVESVAKTGGLGERLITVITVKPGKAGREFRKATENDRTHFAIANKQLLQVQNNIFGNLPTIPGEELPYLRSIFNVHVYGVTRWSQLFNDRQLLAAVTFSSLVRDVHELVLCKTKDIDLSNAVMTILALAVDRQINALNRTCYWNPTGPKMQAGFARQAIPMFWDYCEANPFSCSVGSWESMLDCVLSVFDTIDKTPSLGNVTQSSATQHPLPDDSADAIITDPPYYDAVPYADLSDFFYVWLKRMLMPIYPALFNSNLSPKELEVVQLSERNPAYAYKTKENFEHLMMVSLAEARRVAKPLSSSVIVFAHQSTAGWEAMLTALIKAGWIVTASVVRHI
jgi:putative DNA methylase